MKIETNVAHILDLMDRPAFCADRGVICCVNQAAESKLIRPGDSAAAMIASGAEEYAAFHAGCLYLTLQLGTGFTGACVTKMGDLDLFSLDREEEDPELHALSLAAQELRQPLSQILAISDQLFPCLSRREDPQTEKQISMMNRSLHQMLRLVGNMSDAATAGISRLELQELTSLIQEITDHAAPLCESAGATLTFSNHPAPIYSLADSQKLERAIYNLLSNALKYGGTGCRINVKLSRSKNTVVLTVSNSACRESTPVSAGMFSRALREPGIGSSQSGLGLGLTLVRAAAAAHRGALLLDVMPSGGVQAVLSLPIRQETGGTLRSPALRIDYAGERDHGLIELSESLPPELFRSKTE